MLIAFKLKLLLACAAGLAGPLAVAPIMSYLSARDRILPEQAIVELKSGHFAYRVAGDFTRAGKPAEAPLVQLSFAGPLTIMKRQVSSAEYQACVDDGGCRALDRDVVVAIDRPAVQVSWHDAEAYASWLSHRTGVTYRLPTDEEWAFAAGSKFADDGVPVDDNNPANAGLHATSAKPAATPEPQPAPSADTTPMKTASPISQAMSGSGPRPASCAARSTNPAGSSVRARIAGSVSPRARTAPTSRTSSATRAPAAALRALRLTISAFGLSANHRHGRACASARHSRSRPLEPPPFNCAWCRRPARMCRFRRCCAGTDFALS